VSIIRKAVETGNYPVVPAKIADAVIAAGLLLRTAQ
jgi:negative regulator of flagellin synthesis FlgM